MHGDLDPLELDTLNSLLLDHPGFGVKDRAGLILLQKAVKRGLGQEQGHVCHECGALLSQPEKLPEELRQLEKLPQIEKLTEELPQPENLPTCPVDEAVAVVVPPANMPATDIRYSLPGSLPGYIVPWNNLAQCSIFDSHNHLDRLGEQLPGARRATLEQLVGRDPKMPWGAFGGCVANFVKPCDWQEGLCQSIATAMKEPKAWISVGGH
jgi:hypothetical protein